MNGDRGHEREMMHVQAEDAIARVRKGSEGRGERDTPMTDASPTTPKPAVPLNTRETAITIISSSESESEAEQRRPIKSPEREKLHSLTAVPSKSEELEKQADKENAKDGSGEKEIESGDERRESDVREKAIESETAGKTEKDEEKNKPSSQDDRKIEEGADREQRAKERHARRESRDVPRPGFMARRGGLRS